MTDFIEIIPNVLSIEECNKIISIIESKSEHFTVENNLEDGIVTTVNEHRNDVNIFSRHFSSFRPAEELVANAIKAHKPEYYDGNKEHFEHLDILKFQKSSAGGGFFDWHTEQGDSATASRFLVWMIYLNTVEKGGHTEFKYQKRSLKPTAGTLVYWPAGYTHIHRAAPDLGEDKYIATGWFSYNRKKETLYSWEE